MQTWILVAHRAGARIFSSRGPGSSLTLVQGIDYPKGRAQNRELETDKAGRYNSKATPATHKSRAATPGYRTKLGAMGHGGRRGGVDPKESAHEHLADVFAKELAELVEHGRLQGLYDNLILIADPKFLGRIKSDLSLTTTKKLVGTLKKDLGSVMASELPRYLDELTDEWSQARLAAG